MRVMGELVMLEESLYGIDKFFIWIIATIVSLIFIYNSFFGNEEMFSLSMKVWIVMWIFGSISFIFLDIDCVHPGLMKFTYVFALLFSLISLYSDNNIFSNMAFFSVFLYPFLDWLDRSLDISENASSTLLFGILKFIFLFIISYLTEYLNKIIEFFNYSL